jgi:hypothetical protein
MSDAELVYEDFEYDKRFFIQTAKNSISSILQVFGEIVSNSDEAIGKRLSVSGGDRGEIHAHYDSETMKLCITDDGIGMDTATMRERLRFIGKESVESSKRSFFHRGLRDVFMAMGGGEVHSIARSGEHLVYSHARFDARRGMAMVASDDIVTPEAREIVGGDRTGTAVIVPLGRIHKQVPRSLTFPDMVRQFEDCVQIRPVLLDPSRRAFLHYDGEPPRRVAFTYHEGEVLIDNAPVRVGDMDATLWVKAAEKPIASSGGRQRRRSGILVRGERAAYEVTVGEKVKSLPGMSRIFGELRIDGIEELQRTLDKEADDESALIYKPDRSGLNDDHPLVIQLVEFIDAKLAPFLADLADTGTKAKVSTDERRRLMKMAQIINKEIRDAGFGGTFNDEGKPKPTDSSTENGGPGGRGGGSRPNPRSMSGALEFSVRRVLILAGETREVDLLVDPVMIVPNTPISVASKAGQIVAAVTLNKEAIPSPDADGFSTVKVKIVAGGSEGRREVEVAAGGYTATLPVHVRFPRASGFISSIDLTDDDYPSGAALYNPMSGKVEVFVGRPEFKQTEAKARKAKRQRMEDPLYRLLIVESVKEAALMEAAQRNAEVAMDELTEAERKDPKRFHSEVLYEYAALAYRLRAALIDAYVDAM